MAQHDMNIANQGFPATRADLNNALQALVSNNSGTSAPSTTFANQWWYDTTNNKMYLRNEANNAWIEVFTLDQTNNEWQLVTGQIQAADGDGLVFKTDDGTTRVTLDDSGRVGIGVTPFASTGYNLQIGGTSQSFISIHNTTTGNTVSDGFSLGNDASNVYVTNRENTPMIFSTNNTERMRILAGGGLTFNGDTAAVNALDDYEEGTLSPKWVNTANQDIFDTPPTVNMAQYTKIGDTVTASAYFNNPGSFGTTGNYNASNPVNISGLPYESNKSASGSNAFYAGAVGWHDSWGGWTADDTPMCYTASGSQRISLVYSNGAGVGSMNQGSIDDAASAIIFSVTYKTTS